MLLQLLLLLVLMRFLLLIFGMALFISSVLHTKNRQLIAFRETVRSRVTTMKWHFTYFTSVNMRKITREANIRLKPAKNHSMPLGFRLRCLASGFVVVVVVIADGTLCCCFFLLILSIVVCHRYVSSITLRDEH